MPLEAAAQPEDWGGPIDDVEPDEFGYTDYEAAPRESEPDGATTWQAIVEDDDEEEVVMEELHGTHYSDGRLRNDH